MRVEEIYCVCVCGCVPHALHAINSQQIWPLTVLNQPNKTPFDCMCSTRYTFHFNHFSRLSLPHSGTLCAFQCLFKEHTVTGVKSATVLYIAAGAWLSFVRFLLLLLLLLLVFYLFFFFWFTSFMFASTPQRSLPSFAFAPGLRGKIVCVLYCFVFVCFVSFLSFLSFFLFSPLDHHSLFSFHFIFSTYTGSSTARC